MCRTKSKESQAMAVLCGMQTTLDMLVKLSEGFDVRLGEREVARVKVFRAALGEARQAVSRAWSLCPKTETPR